MLTVLGSVETLGVCGCVSGLAFKLNISELLVSSSGANVTEIRHVFKQPPPIHKTQLYRSNKGTGKSRLLSIKGTTYQKYFYLYV